MSERPCAKEGHVGGRLHYDQALEFDAQGNPVGQTAVLAAEIHSELEAAIHRGEDLSA